MKAVVLDGFGSTEMMRIGDCPDPQIKPDELLVRVKATALNRADLLQRRGLYPPPPGASDILGLEMAGEVVQAGAETEGWRPGDRVCALLPGGGYASLVGIPAGMAIRLPDHFTYEQGAAIPEAFLTAYLNLFWLGQIRPDSTVLIHAGASGVGTAAIQLAREAGATPVVTAGSPRKLDLCRELGALAGWNYKDGSFAPWIRRQTAGKGVQLILDFVGGPYFQDNLDSLDTEGRLIMVGMLGGAKASGVNLGKILAKRLQIIGTTLRSRDPREKIKLTRDFIGFAESRFREGELRPVIDRVMDWREVRQAHEYMESNANLGKIVLTITEA